MKALLGRHGFTGCDSVSAFSRRGKNKPLVILGSSDVYIKAFSNLGTSLVPSDETLSIMDSFTCHMYGKKNASADNITINDVRYTIYCQKAGKISCDAFPPCWNSLKQHVKRANYQVYVWRSSLQRVMNVADPIGHGCFLADGKIDIQWMTCSPAPEEVLELISCNYRSCANQCPCREIELPCTDACTCKSCDNQEFDDSEVESDEHENYDLSDSDSD